MHTKLLNDLLTDRKTVLQKRNTVRGILNSMQDEVTNTRDN